MTITPATVAAPLPSFDAATLTGLVTQLSTLVTSLQSAITALSQVAAGQQAQVGAATLSSPTDVSGGGAPAAAASSGCSCGSQDAVAGAVATTVSQRGSAKHVGGANASPETSKDDEQAHAKRKFTTDRIVSAAKATKATDTATMPALTRKNPRSVDEAIAWARDQVNNPSKSWDNLCLSFVAHAYGWSGSGVNYAIDHYKNAPATARHDGDTTPPPGALVYWDTGKRAGHVALYLGNGMIASNDVNRQGKIDIVPMSDISKKWGAKYLGWQAPNFPAGG